MLVMSAEGHTALNESHERQVIGARATATKSPRTFSDRSVDEAKITRDSPSCRQKRWQGARAGKTLGTQPATVKGREGSSEYQ
jgi:hypothetical protein